MSSTRQARAVDVLHNMERILPPFISLFTSLAAALCHRPRRPAALPLTPSPLEPAWSHCEGVGDIPIKDRVGVLFHWKMFLSSRFPPASQWQSPARGRGPVASESPGPGRLPPYGTVTGCLGG
eukprot:767016-Hanusia_phi.AAC.9